MKPQDIVFLIILAVLLYKRDARLFVWSGIICLVAAIPLFARWIFFTAERLTWYAALCFLLAIFFSFYKLRKIG